MKRIGPETRKKGLRACLALAAAVLLGGHALPAIAQDVLQLNVPAEEYTFGRFKYKAPRTDGWRQMANITGSLSLVYAQQPEPDKIETVFGVAMEVHDIPEGVKVESAAALAAVSANQMAEARKADLVARSPVEAVPSLDNVYTYRLMVHSPVAGQPDGYEIYYVVLAPDKTQYLVIQCIAKSENYANELYFTELYASLASIKYTPDPNAAKPAEGTAAPTGEAAKPAADAPKTDAPPAAH